ncbi:MAG TPA: hypothetical protein VN618_12360 [Solirubrobacteraceae bacterium]|nr:hypothetical protein [Solirubrobacteraceae bacterium]
MAESNKPPASKKWTDPSRFWGAVLVAVVAGLVLFGIQEKPWEGSSAAPKADAPSGVSAPTVIATGHDLERYIEEQPVWSRQPVLSAHAVATAMRDQTAASGRRRALALSRQASNAYSAGTLVAEGGPLVGAEVVLVGRIGEWNVPGIEVRGWGAGHKLTELHIVAPYSKRWVYAVTAEPIRAHTGEVVFARAIVVGAGHGSGGKALTAVVFLESLNHEHDAAKGTTVSKSIRDFHTPNPHRNGR